jgi:DNA-binding CsgD family transcriptional regulator
MHLTPQRLMRLANCSTQCRDEKTFQSFIEQDIKPCLPHRKLVAAVGFIAIEHIHIERLVGVGHTPEALRLFPSQLNLRERPVVMRWLKTRSPCVIELPRDAEHTSAREQQEIEELHLGRLAIHGMLDLHGNTGTYFSFSQLEATLPEQQALRTLTLILPHLHQALLQVHLNAPLVLADDPTLTPIEIALLRWLEAGRTNAQIALLRDRSEATIRNQLHRIFAKLGASSRTEAVFAFHRLSQRHKAGLS